MAKLLLKNSFVLFAACLLVYSNSLQNDFLLDDYRILFSEKGIQHFKSIIPLFTNDQNGFYRPIGHIGLWLTYLVFRENPAGYHIVNVLLFFLICWLFFIIVNRLFSDEKLALLTSLLFAVHPINGMLVNYKTASVISAFVVCIQASTIFFLRFIDGEKRHFYFFSLLFFVLSLFSHEMSLLLPLYLVLIMRFLKDLKRRKIIFLNMGYIAIAVLFLWIRSQVGDLRPVDTLFKLNLSLSVYTASLARLISWYCSKLIIPKDLLFIWDIKPVHEHSVFWAAGLLVSLLAVFYLIFFRWKKGLKAFSLALFVSGFILTGLSSFVYTNRTGTAIIEPHWFYFSSLGFFLLLAKGILELKERVSRKVWIFALAGVVLAFFISAKAHNRLWNNEETYCRYWISLNPLNAEPKYRLAAYYIRHHDKGTDIRDYPHCNSLAHLAAMYMMTADYKKAQQYYFLALEKNPQCLPAHAGLGILYGDVMKDYPRAEACYRKSLELDSANADIYFNLAAIYAVTGPLKEAMKAYQRVLEINPRHAEALYNLGIIYVKLGMYQEAVDAYQKAVEVDPKHISSLVNLSAIYFEREEFEEARRYCRLAQALGYKPPAHYLEELKKHEK